MDAREQKLKEYSAAIKYTAQKFGCHSVPAEDLAQEARIALVTKPYNPEHGVKEITYVYSTATHAMVDYIRKDTHKGNLVCVQIPEAYENLSTDTITDIDNQIVIRQGLSLLRPRHRAILRCLLAGYSNTETAQKFGISQGRVSQIYKEAVNRIRGELVCR